MTLKRLSIKLDLQRNTINMEFMNVRYLNYVCILPCECMDNKYIGKYACIIIYIGEYIGNYVCTLPCEYTGNK